MRKALKVSLVGADAMVMAPTNDTSTLVLTFTRGAIICSNETEGWRMFAVDSDGPVRGRDLVWVDRGEGSEHRIIPANAFSAWRAR